MTLLRKKCLAWFFALTLVFVPALTSGYIYLHEAYPTDQSYVEMKIVDVASIRGYKLGKARIAGVLDEDIVDHLIKLNKVDFDEQWLLLRVCLGSLYVVLILGIVAILFRIESKPK
jgi:hypothetical protein